jgi:long-subunit fatty acid transport protein
MIKKIFLILFFLLISETGISQVGSYAGAFSRMGFGARGMSMGNAMVSNIHGDVNGFYNPALSTFQEQGLVNLGYTFLSLDRKLNFVGFSKKFSLPNIETGGAGITFAWINAGVTDIDGRDNDTRQIGTFSTFENEFYLGLGFITSPQVSIGVAFKLYYASLFNDVTATSIAFDAGAIYKANDDLSFGVSVRDLSAKYEWNTSNIYGASGNQTKDKFPVLLNIGATYKLPNEFGIVSIEAEHFFNPKIQKSDEIEIKQKNNTIIKVGTEYSINPNLKIRAGVDRLDFSSEDFGGNVKPSAGFGFSKSFSESVILGLDYAFQLEPYTKKPIQNLGIVFKFK